MHSRISTELHAQYSKWSEKESLTTITLPVYTHPLSQTYRPLSHPLHCLVTPSADIHTPMSHAPHSKTVQTPCTAHMPVTRLPCLPSRNNGKTTVLSPPRFLLALHHPPLLLRQNNSTFSLSTSLTAGVHFLLMHSAVFSPRNPDFVCCTVVVLQSKAPTFTVKSKPHKHHPDTPVVHMASIY